MRNLLTKSFIYRITFKNFSLLTPDLATEISGKMNHQVHFGGDTHYPYNDDLDSVDVVISSDKPTQTMGCVIQHLQELDLEVMQISSLQF